MNLKSSLTLLLFTMTGLSTYAAVDLKTAISNYDKTAKALLVNLNTINAGAGPCISQLGDEMPQAIAGVQSNQKVIDAIKGPSSSAQSTIKGLIADSQSGLAQINQNYNYVTELLLAPTSDPGCQTVGHAFVSMRTNMTSITQELQTILTALQ